MSILRDKNKNIDKNKGKEREKNLDTRSCKGRNNWKDKDKA